MVSNLAFKIELWWTELNLPSDTIETLSGYLDKSEKEAISKLKFEWLRNRAVISKGLLRALIAGYLGKHPSELKFSFNDFGKPFLADTQEDLQFNLSHSDDVIVFAFTSGYSIGVDIERIKNIEDMAGVADICFTKYENNWMHKTVSLPETFYKIWTIKEAFIKAIGKGFSFSPKDIELKKESEDLIQIKKINKPEFAGNFQVKTIKLLPDYVLSLVYEGKKDIEIYNWKGDI